MFKQILETKNKTPGVNTCEYIILHHTATWEWTIKWVINWFIWSRQASAHYVIDTNGDIYKIWNDKDVLWHAWLSKWQWKTDLNKYSIWIEIIWPLANWWFTDKQKDSTGELLKYLSDKYGIKKENILRHKDISPGRKTDIADSFWNKKFKTFDDYKNSLFVKKEIMWKTKYTDIMNNVIKETWFTPIFWTHEWSNTISEQEVKELIEIACARLSQRNLK